MWVDQIKAEKALQIWEGTEADTTSHTLRHTPECTCTCEHTGICTHLCSPEYDCSHLCTHEYTHNTCACICMSIFMHMYIVTCTSKAVYRSAYHVNTFKQLYALAHTCIHLNMTDSMHACMYPYTPVYMYVSTVAYNYILIYTVAYVYIPAHTYMLLHTLM